MKIKIANKVFEIHFLYEKEYIPFFSSYIVEEDEPNYYIYQDTYEEEIDKGYLKIASKKYDLYEKNGIDVHYHNSENGYIGKIVYGERVTFASKDYHNVDLNVSLIHYIITRLLMNDLDCVLLKGSAFSNNSKGVIIVSPNEEDAYSFSKLWGEYEDIVFINAYMNFLVLEEDSIKIYGSPWSSNLDKENNVIVELSNIIFLYRDENNHVNKLAPTEVFLKITNQIVTPQNERGLEVMNKVIDKIVKLNNYISYSKFDKESIELVKKEIDCL